MRTWVLWSSLVAISSAYAQAPARPDAAVCAEANWTCVAECIDVRCIDRCLQPGCQAKLTALRSCTVKKGCPGTDPTCGHVRCAKACKEAFGGSGFRAKTQLPGCETLPESAVPPRWVGSWMLTAAGLGVRDIFGESVTPTPRADYARALTVHPSGCFVLETRLEDATLGQGHGLVVRAWGRLAVTRSSPKKDPDQADFLLEAAVAEGSLCGHERRYRLSPKARSLGTFRIEPQDDTLTLVERTATGQTFQFRREGPSSP